MRLQYELIVALENVGYDQKDDHPHQQQKQHVIETLRLAVANIEKTIKGTEGAVFFFMFGALSSTPGQPAEMQQVWIALENHVVVIKPSDATDSSTTFNIYRKSEVTATRIMIGNWIGDHTQSATTLSVSLKIPDGTDPLLTAHAKNCEQLAAFARRIN